MFDMSIFRKIFLVILAVVIAVGAYLAYRFYANPPAISVGKGYTVVKAKPQPTESTETPMGKEGSIGETVVGETEVSEFNLLDPQGNIKSRFGFEKLVHSEGLEWELEKPYVDIYDPKYSCKVVSQTGFVRIDIRAGKPVPVSARLIGDVAISLKTTDGGRNCNINLDKLNYDIQRNRFESDGKVAVKADQIEMNGTGMTLVYNPDANRIELLRIPDLDYIKLTEQRLIAQTEKSEQASTETAQTTTPKPKQQDQVAQDGIFYEFILDNGVEITTEEENITADTVRISNILWKNSAISKSDSAAEPEVAEDAAKSSKPAKADDGFTYWQPENNVAKKQTPQPKPEEIYETVTTLYVTSGGGLIFRPHEIQPDKGSNGNIDLIGEPVKITAEQFAAQTPYLWYDMKDKDLRLSSRGNGEIVLLTSDQKAALHCDDHIIWNESKQLATVKGPGYITFNNSLENEYQGAKIEFADTIKMLMAAGGISKVDVTGGFRAKLDAAEPATVEAASASLLFLEDNRLDKLKLLENVQVVSAQGGVNADQVEVKFETDADGKQKAALAIASGNAKLLGGEGGSSYHPVLNASKIEYNLTDQSAVASGGIELSFTVPSPGDEKGNNLPIRINADKDVVYRAGDGYMEFAGNVRGLALAEKDGYSEQSVFNCERLKVYLDGNSENIDGFTLKRIELEGEKVVFENKRFTPNQLLSIVETECKGFVYDAVSGIVRLTGPGQIQVNNRNVAGSSSNTEISLGGPCYALIENFSLLTIDTFSGIITAQSSENLVHIGYIPILADGSTGTERLIDAGRIELRYAKQSDGTSKISFLRATEKVYYYEPDKYQLIGDNFEYQAYSNEVVIQGTPNNPCVLNNTLVDKIEYNIKTGTLRSTIGGVSSIDVR